MNKYLAIKLDWRDRIKKGDVLRSGGGALRVVRQVRISPATWRNGPRVCVSLAIMRCSWTTLPYTVINRSDLATMGYTPTRSRVKLTKRIDRKIEQSLNSRNAAQCLVHCCDVKGIR